MKEKGKGRTGDLWLALGVLAAAAALGLLLWLWPSSGTAVEVTVAGQVIATLPLDQDTALVIPGVSGGENTLVIEKGQATVTAADCPDGVCMRHRPISRVGQSILCLPHRVAITVIGEDAPSVDGEA